MSIKDYNLNLALTLKWQINDFLKKKEQLNNFFKQESVLQFFIDNNEYHRYNELLNDYSYTSKDRQTQKSITEFLDKNIYENCEHEWTEDSFDYMFKDGDATRTITYCKKCELLYNTN